MTVVGTDIVKTARFEGWQNRSDAQLLKVFHPSEVAMFRAFVFKDTPRAIQFLASRFAVKEAFFKVFSALPGSVKNQTNLPFLRLARMVRVVHGEQRQPHLPQELLDQLILFPVQASLSLSHEECCCVAFVSVVVQL